MRYPLPNSLADYTATYPLPVSTSQATIAGKLPVKYPVIVAALAITLSFTPQTTSALTAAQAAKPDLRKTTLTQEVLERYSIVRNAFVQKSTADPVNGYTAEIGDSKQDDFYPQIKISKWGNEANFSARLVDTDSTPATVEIAANKIKWKKPTIEAHFYDKGFDEETGAFEHEVILNSKPATNILQWTVNTKDFTYLHQGALTQPEIDNGNIRPDKYVDCIIAYHATKRDYIVGQKNYKTGQAFIIERIRLIDANSATAWGTQSIDPVTGLWTVTLPQAFLDSAVYPVVVDPTFGYTTVGSTSTNNLANSVIAMSGTTGGNAGRAISTLFYGKTATTANVKSLIAKGSDKTLVAGSIGTAINIGNTQKWNEIVSSSTAALSASTSYYAGVVADATITFYYNAGSGAWQDTGNSYSTPTDLAGGAYSAQVSIYSVYVENASILTGDQTVTATGYGIWQATSDGTIKGEVWGSGAAGKDLGGLGGGGGGYARVNSHAVTSGDYVPFYVAPGGVYPATFGANSWIVSPASLSGGAGLASTGGTGSGSLSDQNYTGGTPNFGYGGGGAGSAANASGQTGGSPDGGNGGSYSTSSGVNGSTIGGGGGSVYSGTPGNGARGQVKITFTASGGGPTTHTISATDGLILDDPATRKRQHLDGDKLLIPDNLKKSQAHLEQNALLLGDRGSTPITRGRFAQDGVILRDAVARALSFVQRDPIYLNSLHSRISRHLLRDGLNLGDNALPAAIRKLLQVDSLLVKDDRFSAVEINFLDKILTWDFLIKTLNKTLRDGLYLYSSVTASTTQPGASAGWLSTSWLYRIKITVDHTKIGGSDLTNYPVFIKLSDLPSSFFSRVQNGGADIRITKDDGTTEIAREVVSCDTSAKTGEIHFLAPSLSSSADTSFYIYFGNAGASDYAATDTYGRNAVWADYISIYHFNEDPTSGINDATGGGHSLSVVGGSMSSSDLVAGKVGNGVTFANETVAALENTSGGNPPMSSPWTVSFWVKTPASLDTFTPFFILGSSADPDWVGVGNTGSAWKIGTNGETSGSGGTVSTSTIYKVDLYYDGSKLYLRINDAAVYNVTPSGSNWQTAVGVRAGGLDGTYYFSGLVDEARVSAAVLSAGRITADYNNQNSPPTFYSLSGTEANLSLSDGILLDDPATRQQSHLNHDDLILQDIMEKALAHIEQNGMLLGDSGISSSARTRLNQDGVFLTDEALKVLSAIQRDPILIKSLNNLTQSHVFRDNLFLDDSLLPSIIRSLIVQDGLLMRDDRFSVIQHSFLDQLMTVDFIFKTLGKIVEDSLFLYDSVTASKITGGGGAINEVAAVDGLILIDAILKQQKAILNDSMIFFDEALKAQFLSAVDGLLIKSQELRQRRLLAQNGLSLYDYSSFIRWMTGRDSMLLQDFIAKTIQALKLDGLLLYDSATTSTISALAVALVYAKLASINVLGEAAGAIGNYLGVEINGNANYLGVTASAYSDRNIN